MAFCGTATQLVLIYLYSEYGDVNPMQVSLKQFVTSQADIPKYNILNLNSVYLIQSSLFIFTAALLYTTIYFVIS